MPTYTYVQCRVKVNAVFKNSWKGCKPVITKKSCNKTDWTRQKTIKKGALSCKSSENWPQLADLKEITLVGWALHSQEIQCIKSNPTSREQWQCVVCIYVYWWIWRGGVWVTHSHCKTWRSNSDMYSWEAMECWGAVCWMDNGMSCEGEGWIHEGNSNDDTVLIASTTVQFVPCVC